MAACQRVVKDHESAKSDTYTYDEELADMVVSSMDECDGQHEDASGERRRRMVDSQGYIVVNRVERQDDGSFKKVRSAVVQRGIEVRLTNSVHTFSAPALSRCSIVSIPGCATADASAAPSTQVLLGHGSKIYTFRIGLIFHLRTMSCFQGPFWQAHATGAFTVDTQMLVVFKCILHTMTNITIPIRRIVDIENEAISHMVLELGSEWYRHGMGAKHKFCKVEEMKFYRKRAYVTTEHIILAFNTSMKSTEMSTPIMAVQNVIRASLMTMVDKEDPNQKMIFTNSDCGLYYITDETERSFASRIINNTCDLGESLSTRLIDGFQKSTLNGRACYKVDMYHNRQRVAVLKEYFQKNMSTVQLELLHLLKRYIESYPAKTNSTKNDDSYVFDANITNMFVCNKPLSYFVGISSEQLSYAFAFMKSFVIINKSGNRVNAMSIQQNVVCRKYVNVSSHHSQLDEVGRNYVLHSIDSEALVINKLFLERVTKPSPLLDVYKTSLAIAGGYEGKNVCVGANMAYTAANIIKVDSSVVSSSINVSNPEYLAASEIPGNIFSSLLDADPIFDISKKKLSWSSASNLEAIVADGPGRQLS
jgi:hypothetical protein